MSSFWVSFQWMISSPISNTAMPHLFTTRNHQLIEHLYSTQWNHCIICLHWAYMYKPYTLYTTLINKPLRKTWLTQSNSLWTVNIIPVLRCMTVVKLRQPILAYETDL